jgi:hypothetical protein
MSNVIASQGQTTLTVAWLKDAVRGLGSGSITPDEVVSSINADRRRLWGWPEFQELRRTKLTAACAECGSSEDLVLQHLIQPRHPGQIRVEVESAVLRQLGVDVRREYEHGDVETHTVPAVSWVGCPECGDRSYYERKTKRPRYRCVNGKPPHAFDEPALVEYPAYEERIPFKVFATERSAAALREHRAEIELRVARSAAEQLIAYFAGQGVITACKRCAYRYDAKRKEVAERNW